MCSPAFAHGSRLPHRFTADGEGISPPLAWSGLPDDTASVALVVEDPDAPAAHPLVHALMWNLPPNVRELPEGAISGDGPIASAGEVGRNSFLATGWLPPDPPSGHGPHDYVFQVFALAAVPELRHGSGRSSLVTALRGQVLAAGLLTGTYARDEPGGSVSSIDAAPA